MSEMTNRLEMNRRRLLTLTAAGVSMATLGRFGVGTAHAADTIRWVSPRGTIEVLDDYPYWVGKKFGYFGDIETTLEPGPSDATASVKLVDQNQADMGYPSPGVFSLGLAQGIPLVSVFEMGGADVFDFAFRKGEAPADIKGLEGKTIVLGSAGWQSIADPMLKAAGVDITKVKYVDAGWPTWGTAVMSGQGDAALSWEGPARAVEGARASTSTTSSAATSRSFRRTASSSARRTSRTRPSSRSMPATSRAGRPASSSAASIRAPRRRSSWSSSPASPRR